MNSYICLLPLHHLKSEEIICLAALEKQKKRWQYKHAAHLSLQYRLTAFAWPRQLYNNITWCYKRNSLDTFLPSRTLQPIVFFYATWYAPLKIKLCMGHFYQPSTTSCLLMPVKLLCAVPWCLSLLPWQSGLSSYTFGSSNYQELLVACGRKNYVFLALPAGNCQITECNFCM